MQNASVNQYQKLVPGISNVTLRVRYYGLYAWLSATYAKRVGSTDLEVWKRYIRRAESLYALIAQHNAQDNGVAGSRWATRKLASAERGAINFAENADPGSPEPPYLKQPWGAYGAAYASQLFEIGVFAESLAHEIPLPSKELGEDLALAFEEAIGPAAETFLKVMERGTVTKATLESLAGMAPSEIASNRRERQQYENMLFAKLQGASKADTERARTLRIVLQIAKELEAAPNSDTVRWAIYSGYSDSGKKLKWESAEQESHRRQWWCYQANDLSHLCFETLLKFTLDTLENYPTGLTMASLISEVVSGLLAVLESKPLDWDQFAQSVTSNDDAWSESDFLSEWNLSRVLLSTNRGDVQCTADQAVNALYLLAILYKHARNKEKDLLESLGQLSFGEFARTLITETKFLYSKRKEPFKTLLGRLVQERVLHRHLWIAMQKLRTQGDYTFLLEAEDGRVRVRQKDGPVFTNPRLGPAITFMHDIHLLNADGLTPRGLKFLEKQS